jgi:hypothetical protein
MTPPRSTPAQPGRRAPAPVASSGAIRSADAEIFGLTRAQMRSRRWTAPVRGVRLPTADVADLEKTCHAISLELGPGVAFSHVTALRLLKIELPWRVQDDHRIHTVGRARRERSQHAPLVAHHATGQATVETVDVGGLRVTSPAQTWVQVGCGLLPDEIVVLGDAMVRRKRPATTVSELRRLAEATYKVKGIVAVREALDRIRARTDSSMETRTRLVVVDAGLPCPEVNYRVHHRGRFVAMVDLAYPELKVAIEYDGDVHRDARQWRKDVQRLRLLEELEWSIVHVVADDITRDSSRFLSALRRARARRRP